MNNNSSIDTQVITMPLWFVLGFFAYIFLFVLAFIFNHLAVLCQPNNTKKNNLVIDLNNVKLREQRIKANNIGIRAKYIEQDGKWVEVDV